MSRPIAALVTVAALLALVAIALLGPAALHGGPGQGRPADGLALHEEGASGSRSERRQAPLWLPNQDPRGVTREAVSADAGLAAAQADRASLGPLVVELSEGALFVDGEPFDKLSIETWPLDALRELEQGLAKELVQVTQRFEAENVTEHLFVSGQEATNLRLWSPELLLPASQQRSLDADGREQVVYGRLAIPRGLCPDGYVLKDAIMHVTAAPAFSSHLLSDGEQYVASVVADNPDCVFDVAPDMSLWVGTNPDGEVVGWKSFPTNGN